MSGLLKNLPKSNLSGFPYDIETADKVYKREKKWPSISIIIPNLNNGKYIEETIRSVVLQNYPDIQIIVIDGGSSDNSIEIIQNYSEWISYWVSEKDNGQANAINKGLEVATGEIVNWLNSDDYYIEGALFSIAKHFLNTNSDMVSGITHQFQTNDQSRIQLIKQVSLKYYFNYSREFNVFFCSFRQPSTFFKRKKIVEVKGLNEEYHYVFDNELFLKYLLFNENINITIIDQTITFFRLHQSSKTISNSEKFTEEYRKLLSSLLSKSNYQSIKKINNEKMKSFHFFYMCLKTSRTKVLQHFYFLLVSLICFPKNTFEILRAYFQYSVRHFFYE